MSMVLYPLLNHDDLRRWRACSRRFWLYRRSEHLVTPKLAGREARAEDRADVSAEAAVVYGPGVDAALRASYPLADIIPPPTTQAEWTRALRQTLHCLDGDRVAPEGWAILGACLTSEDRAQARIDVLTCGERGLRLFKLRYATVGDESDVDTAAFWTDVAARCGLRVQSVGLLLVDTDFIYPGHGCYAGLFREVREFFELKGSIVQRRGEPEAVFDEGLFSGPIAIIHAPYLRDRGVRFVYKCQKIFRKIIYETPGPRAGSPSG